jgi:hypothetical protein
MPTHDPTPDLTDEEAEEARAIAREIVREVHETPSARNDTASSARAGSQRMTDGNEDRTEAALVDMGVVPRESTAMATRRADRDSA